MRNVILKSFETFVAQPFSVLCNKIIRIASLKSTLTDLKSVTVQLFDDTVQVNVTNSPKVYNLLSAVAYKKRMHQLRGGNGSNSNDKDTKDLLLNQLTLS